jgi:hypothetical protein
MLRVLMLTTGLAVASIGSPNIDNLVATAQTVTPRQGQQDATVILDNVTLNIRTPYLPNPFVPTLPNELKTTSSNPNGSFEIAVAPFGFVPPTESIIEDPLPRAAAGGADAYRAKLREYKIARFGGTPQPGPTATLFGQRIESQVTLFQIDMRNPGNEPAVSVEWVVEAGKRIWILRIVKRLPAGTQDLSAEQPFLDSLEQLQVSSNTLDNPTTVTPIPSAGGTPTIPGMPATGAARSPGGTSPGLLLLLFSIVAGLFTMGGVLLRRRLPAR